MVRVALGIVRSTAPSLSRTQKQGEMDYFSSMLNHTQNGVTSPRIWQNKGTVVTAQKKKGVDRSFSAGALNHEQRFFGQQVTLWRKLADLPCVPAVGLDCGETYLLAYRFTSEMVIRRRCRPPSGISSAWWSDRFRFDLLHKEGV